MGALDIFLASSDTTAASVEGAMSELIRNPKAMIEGTGRDQGSTRRRSGGRRKRPPLVVKEVLRLYPPAPLLLARECSEDCEVPTKTRVLVNVWANHREPRALGSAGDVPAEVLVPGELRRLQEKALPVPFLRRWEAKLSGPGAAAALGAGVWTWLRDTGYLEVLDERSSASSPSSSSPSSSAAAAANQPRRRPVSSDSAISASSAAAAPSSPASLRGDARRGGLRGALGRVGGSALVGVVRTLLAIAATNPIAKLAPEDFSGNTPPWTAGFLTSGGGGQASSYSWPAGPEQARMRIHENVKRYARNYACLWLIFFACTLYKMPLALLGLVSSLAIWEALRIGSSWWDLEERYPGLRFVLVRVAQLGEFSGCYFVADVYFVITCDAMGG
ncbi:hypothetical protein Taro_002210 [Colocasia esculenta]|uniref:PRA1 family protein n=1 Tax=Colocasia esculenta TaxID=4460 RepID=A0A843TC60_COLES|nr:hypothetical protein [Colocasia esculenta]